MTCLEILNCGCCMILNIQQSMQENTVSVILWSLHSYSLRGDWILNRHHICRFLNLTLDIWSNFLKKKKRKKISYLLFFFRVLFKKTQLFSFASFASCSSRPEPNLNPTQNQNLTQTSTDLNPNLIQT